MACRSYTWGRTWQTGPCSGILRQKQFWMRCETDSATDSLLYMMLQLSLRCLKKKFTSHHLRPEIPVSEGGTGGQNEHLPCEYVIASDKKFDFTLHLSSSANLHIHAFLQQQDWLLHSVIATRKGYSLKKTRRHSLPTTTLLLAEPACFSVLRILLVMGLGSLIAEIQAREHLLLLQSSPAQEGA